MITKIIKYAVLTLALVKMYNCFYDKMIKDEEYLRNICKEARENECEQIIYKTFSEARKHEESMEFDIALEYYLYAFKVLKCEKSFIMENVLTDKLRNMLETKI